MLLLRALHFIPRELNRTREGLLHREMGGKSPFRRGLRA